MDIHGSSHVLALLVLVLALFLVPILLLSLNGKRRKDGPKLPPRPWQLPVIGSLHHLLTKNPRLVHRTLTDLARRRDAPIMYLRLGELPVVVISSPEGAEEVMRTHHTTFASRAMSLTIRTATGDRLGLAFLPYGDRWRRLRKICAVELLGAKRVRSFRSIREDEASCLAAAIAASPPGELVNVSKAVVAYVADSAQRAIMGERFRWRDEFLRLLDEAVKKTSGFSAGDLFPSSRLACTVDGTVREVRALTEKMIEMVGYAIDQFHERNSKADGHRPDNECLLEALLRIHEEGDALPMDTIKAIIIDIFAAASDTTSTALQWAMSELMRNPKVMHKVQAEVRLAMQGKSRVTEEDLIGLNYLKHVIKETLRLHPSVPLIPRECRESCNILGYKVPKGTTVIVNAWAIGRDPNYWDDIEVFKPERFEGITVDFKGTNSEFIPFGAGRRICPGITFAHAIMELALAVLLYHFNWQLPLGVTPDGMDMAEDLGSTVGRKNDLYLRPTLHVPLEATLTD